MLKPFLELELCEIETEVGGMPNLCLHVVKIDDTSHRLDKSR